MEDCDSSYRDLQNQLDDLRVKVNTEKADLIKEHELRLLELYTQSDTLKDHQKKSTGECQTGEQQYL